MKPDDVIKEIFSNLGRYGGVQEVVEKIYTNHKLELEAEYKRGWKDRAAQSDLENKTCEGCKYLNEFDRCIKNVSNGTSYTNGVAEEDMKTFSCCKWEQK